MHSAAHATSSQQTKRTNHQTNQTTVTPKSNGHQTSKQQAYTEKAHNKPTNCTQNQTTDITATHDQIANTINQLLNNDETMRTHTFQAGVALQQHAVPEVGMDVR